MKIKDGFILREVAGTNVVVNVKGNADLRGMVTLNETGAFIWRLLETERTEDEIVKALAAEYGISEEIAKRDVRVYIDRLKGEHVIE